MAKKYKLLFLIVLIVATVVLITNGNRTRLYISEGTYSMVAEDNVLLKPYIHFYEER